ncbi:hypothetical protein HQ560_17055 [bacterium]|nr:hypothetical protein [bacterium]
MPSSPVKCRACGSELEGREIYEGICGSCHEDEVLGKTPKPKPRKSPPRGRPKPAPPPVDMEADTREIEPLPDPDAPVAPAPEPADPEELVIALDSAGAPDDLIPLEDMSLSETQEPELLSLVSSSPAMEIPAHILRSLSISEEPELPLDDDDDDALDDDEEGLTPPEPQEEPLATPPKLRVEDEDEPAPEFRIAFQDEPTLAAKAQPAQPARPRRQEDDSPLMLAASPQGDPFHAIERESGRVNALHDRITRLERLQSTRSGSFPGGMRTGLGFAFGVGVGLAALAGLAALVGATVYPPALEWLKGLFGGGA